MSPISSRNNVPPSACSKRPRRIVCAPVNAPRSWPNNSLSSRSFGIAAVLMATKGPLLPASPRGLCLCNACATSSLPEPLSPVISTVTLLWLESADCAKHVLHGRCLSKHLGHLRRALVAHFFAQALVHRAPDELDRLRHVEGLRQVFESASLERGNGAVEIGVRRHHDHRQAGQSLLDLAQQIDARAPGHADVRHQHLRLVVVERRAARREGC